MNRQNLGFTLIELIITMVIAAIVVTIGVPSFRNIILNNTRVAQVNEFVGALNLARSEAAKSGLRATICRSADGATCATDTTGVWGSGWIVYVDRNQDSSLSSGETIKVQGSIPQSFTLQTSGALTQSVTYLANGTLFSPGSIDAATCQGVFKLCDYRGVDQARFIEISVTGRVAYREKKTSGEPCSCP
jgi:type IV fimbrial biogenesis protein FimT